MSGISTKSTNSKHTVQMLDTHGEISQEIRFSPDDGENDGGDGSCEEEHIHEAPKAHNHLYLLRHCVGLLYGDDLGTAGADVNCETSGPLATGEHARYVLLRTTIPSQLEVKE